MKESVYRKLETLVERYEEVQALLSDHRSLVIKTAFVLFQKNTLSLKKW